MAMRATGKVIRLFTHSRASFIRLDIPLETGPKNGYFVLKLDNKNYNALYSLVLAAAANRWPLTIRTAADIVPAETAEILYLVVDWQSGQADDSDEQSDFDKKPSDTVPGNAPPGASKK